MAKLSDVKDLRFLATKDIHHNELSKNPIAWWQTLKYDLIITKDTDNVPLVGSGITPEICPIDPSYEIRLLYWVSNLEKGNTKVEEGLAKSCITMMEYLTTKNIDKIWGFVPKYATHLLTFLGKMYDAGMCKRMDGDAIEWDGEGVSPHINHVYYLGEREKVDQFAKRFLGVK